MCKPLLSIIIPVYNVEPYIRRCLDSIFTQSEASPERNEVEVVVVNDGTPDGSMGIVEEFDRRYTNIIVVNQANQGLSMARNNGMETCHGRYVWFVDSDDSLKSDAFATVLPLIRKGGFDLMVMDYIQHITATGKEWTVGAFVKTKYERHYGEVHPGLFFGNKVGPGFSQKIIFYHGFLNQNGLRFYPGILHEDDEFLPRCFHKAERMVCQRIAPYEYMVRTEGSIMSEMKLRNYRDTLTIVQRHWECAKGCNSCYERSIFLANCMKEGLWIITSHSNHVDVQAFQREHRDGIKCMALRCFLGLSPQYFSLGRCWRLFKGLLT